jgi:cytochrome P450
VRYETPVQTFFRTTTRPVEIDGIELGKGEKVLMFLGAANRDPRRWERPDEYDISRRTIAMLASAAASINASARCWRGSKANAC